MCFVARSRRQERGQSATCQTSQRRTWLARRKSTTIRAKGARRSCEGELSLCETQGCVGNMLQAWFLCESWNCLRLKKKLENSTVAKEISNRLELKFRIISIPDQVTLRCRLQGCLVEARGSGPLKDDVQGPPAIVPGQRQQPGQPTSQLEEIAWDRRELERPRVTEWTQFWLCPSSIERHWGVLPWRALCSYGFDLQAST